MAFNIEQEESGSIKLYRGAHMFTGEWYTPKSFVEIVSPGDTILFGNHHLETSSSEPEVVIPLQWTVLKKTGARLLLLNKYQVMLTLVGNSDAPFSYRDSYIRQELKEVLPEWFKEKELQLIEDTHLGKTSNPAFDTIDNPDVRDKLFLLSAEEVLEFFDPDAYQVIGTIHDKLIPNEYRRRYYPMSNAGADAQYAFVDTSSKDNREIINLRIIDFLGWWTRTPGCEDGDVALYETGGKLNLDGLSADSDEVGIRPALWLDLSRID